MHGRRSFGGFSRTNHFWVPCHLVVTTHPLTPQPPHFLTDFSDETHPVIGVPDSPPVPHTRTRWEVKFSDLVITDGLHHKKFTDVPFTGKITGNLQGSIRNGKKVGPWVEYHENGQLFTKRTYKNVYYSPPYKQIPCAVYPAMWMYTTATTGCNKYYKDGD